MEHASPIEAALRRALVAFHGARAPSRLGEAMAYALFPGGARLRPTLALAVASTAEGGTTRAMPAAVALEILHGASLVHDDLPCFDDAALRRHKPSVHRAFDQPTAVLAGDALLALAFRAVGDLADPFDPAHQRVVAEAATYLMHGQALEQEDQADAAIDLHAYHHGKTGSLFEAATCVGALAAGLPVLPWAKFGRQVGAAYQIADDLLDATAAQHVTGKTAGRDAEQNRPSMVALHGMAQAQQALQVQLRRLRSQCDALGAPAAVRVWLAALGRKVAPCTGDDATLGAGQAARTGGEACATSVATGG